MKINKKNIFLFAILLVILLSSGVVFYICNSPNAIIFLLGGLDKPSKLHTILSNRLYSKSIQFNLGDMLLYHLRQKKNMHFYDLYIHTLGVIGEDKAIDYLLNECVEQKVDTQLSSKMYYIVLSMGMIGDKTFTPILEKMLHTSGYDSYGVTKYSIARALYLITGKRYEYIGQTGKKVEITLTEELVGAREIVSRPKEYIRIYSDMLLLARLDLP